MRGCNIFFNHITTTLIVIFCLSLIRTQVMIPSMKLFVYGRMRLVLCPPTNLDPLREDFMSFFGLFLSLKTYLFVLLVIDDEDRLCYHFHYIIAFSDPLGHHQLMYIHRRYQK